MVDLDSMYYSEVSMGGEYKILARGGRGNGGGNF
jgi:hypothetical protein